MPALRRFPSALLLLFILTRIATADPEAPLPSVPEGFTVQRVAGSPLIQHPTMACFDDAGRLYVCESAGTNRRAQQLVDEPLDEIRVLEDTDGDGIFDKAWTFADKLTFPQGCLWYRGAVYTCSPPNVWKLEDTDGDGVCDKRTVLINSFGFNGNAASIHGPFPGPDGRLYWCDGRHGHEFFDEDGNVVSKGRAARVFSCLPDGSDVQVLAGGGMDNPVEVDFLDTGEVVGTCNLFYGRPRGDCLVHWTEGGVYPRYDQQDCIAEFKSTGDLIAQVYNYGHVAVSGMCRYRSDQFGDDYRDNVFVTEFNTHKVVRSVIERDGATLAHRETTDFVVWDDPDVHPTDVLEDADGSLLVIDTGGWFRIGCPTSQIAKPEIAGAIWRIRRDDAHQVDDPYGLAYADETDPRALAALLSDPRPAVRERATEQLAQSGQASDVAADLSDLQLDTVARRQLAWALTRSGDPEDARALAGMLNDADESVVLAALTGLSRVATADTYEALAALEPQSPAQRRALADAWGRIAARERRAGRPAPDAVSNVLALMSPGADRILEHAVMFALMQFDRTESLRAALGDASSPAVQRAALVALDQAHGEALQRDWIVPLLETEETALRDAVIEVLNRHDGWAAESLGVFSEWLTADEMSRGRRGLLGRYLLEHFAQPEFQAFIAESLSDSATTDAGRVVLLEVMERACRQGVPAELSPPLRAALGNDDPAVRYQAVRVVLAAPGSDFIAAVRPLAGETEASDQVRMAALQATFREDAALSDEAFAFLLSSLADADSQDATLAVCRVLAEAPMNDEQLVTLAGRLSQAGPLGLSLVLQAFSRSQSPAVGEALVAAIESLDAGRAVDRYELESLIKRYPEPVHKAAAPLLARLASAEDRDPAQIEALLPLAEGGNAARGRLIFFSKQIACGSCHRVGNEGGEVGPALSTIGAIRQPRDLVEAIVYPSASFARGYRPYAVLTDSGRVFTGVISRETASEVILRTTDLAEIRIPRDEIDVLKESDTSVMPKGLHTRMTEDQLRDLLAFLQSLK